MTRKRGRPRREGADEEILAVAADLLKETGYRELTVDAVAERAGVAKTTVYRRWPTKGALIAAALAPMQRSTGSLEELVAEACEVLRLFGDARADADVWEVLAPWRRRVEGTPLMAELLFAPLLVTREPLDSDLARRIVHSVLRGLDT